MHTDLRSTKSFYKESFLYALIIALSFLLPYIIKDRGMFLFYGDYSVQQVPFYMLMHDSIRSGNVFWSWVTDLGANFFGTYSFYNVGSPFFLSTLAFPDAVVPYLLGPLLALKIAMGSMTAYAFIQRFVRTKELAVVGGLLYSMSSFSIYNIFFNHFHEAIAFFPLLLIALEELMQHNRRGWFAVMVFVCAMNNYFFFILMVIFLFLYWVLRSLSGGWELTFRKFVNVAFESLLGLGLASVLFIPAILQVMGNTRINNTLSGWNLLVYGWTQRFPDIVHSVFFPQDLPAFPNFFPDSGANWSSVAAYLPVFSMSGVIAFLYAKRGTWLRRIIFISFAMALIPGLNAIYVLMVDSFYGRWYFMPVLMMATATIIAFDDRRVDLMHGLKWTAFFTAAFVFAIGFNVKSDNLGKIKELSQLEELFRSTMRDPAYLRGFIAVAAVGVAVTAVLILRQRAKDVARAVSLGILGVIGTIVALIGFFFAVNKLTLEPYPDRFWGYVGLGGAGLLASYFMFKHFRNDRRRLANVAVVCITVFACIFGNYFIYMGKTYAYDSNWYQNNVLNGAKNITLPKENGQYNYRIDILNGMDNQSLFWRIPSIQAFNTVVPKSIMEFYPSVGVARDVGSRPASSTVGLRALLSVRYLYDNNNSDSIGMTGFTYMNIQDGIKVWKNDNYIPFGFTFTNYLTQDQFNNASSKDRILVKALLLTSEQIKKYGGLLSPLDDSDTYALSDEDLRIDAQARNTETASYFSYDKRGFTARITLAKKNLVFFSVPYDNGWTATVNGKPAAIEKVDTGFMAVVCDAGSNDIRFNYLTPGLIPGLVVTVLCILLFVGYWFFAKKYLGVRLFKADPETLSITDEPEEEEEPEEPESEQELLPEDSEGFAQAQADEPAAPAEKFTVTLPEDVAPEAPPAEEKPADDKRGE